MTVRVKNHNEYPDCAGLEQSIPQGLEENVRFPLVVELICGWEPVLWKHISFRMAIKEGTVRLVAERCNVERGSRFADLPNRERASERAVLRTQENSDTSVGLDGSLAIGSVTAVARARGQASIRTTVKRSRDHLTVSQLNSRKVRAGGTTEHPSWPIRTVSGGDALQGRQVRLWAELNANPNCVWLPIEFTQATRIQKRSLCLLQNGWPASSKARRRSCWSLRNKTKLQKVFEEEKPRES